MAESKQIATTNSVVALQDSSSLEGVNELDMILRGKADVKVLEVITDPEEISRQIAQRILDADSDEMPEAKGWENLLDVPVEVHGFRWAPSQFESGPPVFMIVDAVNLTNGNRELLTTGSYNVLCQLCNIAKREAFPAIRMLKQTEKPTKNNFYPQRLVPVTPEQLQIAEVQSSDEIPF